MELKSQYFCFDEISEKNQNNQYEYPKENFKAQKQYNRKKLLKPHERFSTSKSLDITNISKTISTNHSKEEPQKEKSVQPRKTYDVIDDELSSILEENSKIDTKSLSSKVLEDPKDCNSIDCKDNDGNKSLENDGSKSLENDGNDIRSNTNATPIVYRDEPIEWMSKIGRALKDLPELKKAIEIERRSALKQKKIEEFKKMKPLPCKAAYLTLSRWKVREDNPQIHSAYISVLKFIILREECKLRIDGILKLLDYRYWRYSSQYINRLELWKTTNNDVLCNLQTQIYESQEELSVALAHVRSLSLSVVESLVKWRSLCENNMHTQATPSIYWENKNYLVYMTTDLHQMLDVQIMWMWLGFDPRSPFLVPPEHHDPRVRRNERELKRLKWVEKNNQYAARQISRLVSVTAQARGGSAGYGSMLSLIHSRKTSQGPAPGVSPLPNSNRSSSVQSTIPQTSKRINTTIKGATSATRTMSVSESLPEIKSGMQSTDQIPINMQKRPSFLLTHLNTSSSAPLLPSVSKTSNFDDDDNGMLASKNHHYAVDVIIERGSDDESSVNSIVASKKKDEINSEHDENSDLVNSGAHSMDVSEKGEDEEESQQEEEELSLDTSSNTTYTEQEEEWKLLKEQCLQSWKTDSNEDGCNFWDTLDHNPRVLEAAVGFAEVFPRKYIIPPLPPNLIDLCENAEMVLLKEVAMMNDLELKQNKGNQLKDEILSQCNIEDFINEMHDNIEVYINNSIQLRERQQDYKRTQTSQKHPISSSMSIDKKHIAQSHLNKFSVFLTHSHVDDDYNELLQNQSANIELKISGDINTALHQNLIARVEKRRNVTSRIDGLLELDKDITKPTMELHSIKKSDYDAATVIQTHIRGVLARKKVIAIREQAKSWKSVCVLQNCIRIILAKKVKREKRRMFRYNAFLSRRWLLVRQKAANTITQFIRKCIFINRKIRFSKKYSIEKLLLKNPKRLHQIQSATTTIQRVFRGYIARKCFYREKQGRKRILRYDVKKSSSLYARFLHNQTVTTIATNNSKMKSMESRAISDEMKVMIKSNEDNIVKNTNNKLTYHRNVKSNIVSQKCQDRSVMLMASCSSGRHFVPDSKSLISPRHGKSVPSFYVSPAINVGKREAFDKTLQNNQSKASSKEVHNLLSRVLSSPSVNS